MNEILNYDIDYSLIYDIDIALLEKFKIIPLCKKELFVLVAAAENFENEKELSELFHYPIKFIQVDFAFIEYEIKDIDFKIQLHKLSSQAISTANIDTNNSYILDFVDLLLFYCVENNASDIHFECLEESIIIRLRIDGELMQLFRFDRRLYLLLGSIIKYLGNLDISQKRLPLNARFSRMIHNENFDIRVSTMPTIFGESIVLRILNNGNIQKSLQSIGLESETLNIVKNKLKLTQGLILVTGPTGSGKTTTLYSMLNNLNNKQKKIITIEDPVEYKLDGVMQVNINNEIDLSYHIVLKNILRQDPDILMIGEIRDTESLQTAMQAALTGHLVIATLHTNSAIETITRLLDLQAEPYLIASTLKMVLSQRLLRILCSSCKKKNSLNHYEPVGCKECNFTGYKGRNIVSEIVSIDKNISNKIAKNKNIEIILESSNFTTIKQNGQKLVDEGITSLSEFYSKL